MISRTCIICGKQFKCYPSDNTVTCSKDCRRERQRRIRTGRSNKWSAEARERASERGQTANLRMGVPAAQRSPVAGRFETNKAAKIWMLIDPSGDEHIVRNLRNWTREHTDLFDKPPSDKSADQISSGFQAIAQTLTGHRGAPGKPRGVMTYFGWTLKGLPIEPSD